MKISNAKFYNKVKILAITLMIGIVLDFTLSQFSGQLGSLFNNHWTAIICSIGLMIIKLYNVSYFYFEAEHEIVHINSKPLLESLLFLKKIDHREFPKSLLHRLTLEKNLTHNKLEVQISSKNKIKKIGHFVISGIPLPLFSEQIIIPFQNLSIVDIPMEKKTVKTSTFVGQSVQQTS